MKQVRKVQTAWGHAGIDSLQKLATGREDGGGTQDGIKEKVHLEGGWDLAKWHERAVTEL